MLISSSRMPSRIRAVIINVWRTISRILTFTRPTRKLSWLNYTKCTARSKENLNFQLETVQLTWLASSPPEWVRSMDSLWFLQHELQHRTDHGPHGMEPENMVCNVAHCSIENKSVSSKIMSLTSTSCRFLAISKRSSHQWNSPTEQSGFEYWEI